MAGYEGSCPSCGAGIVFELGSSLLKVCEHCGVAVARKGADLAAYGRVASLIPTPSVLKLGLEGGYSGAPPFKLVGRLQLDYGAGTWDEWLMGFGNGSSAWLSESQGRFHYLGELPLPPVPGFQELSVGATLDLGPPGSFVVAEVRQARFMTAQGELPFDIAPGSLLNYADLSGPDGQFATLDYGTGAGAQALYVGREVALEDIGLRGVPEEERHRAAKGAALSCPQCGGPLELKAPDLTQRVACPYCGSLLDATKDLAVLEALARPQIKPLIPLGSKGQLRGVEWDLIGFMERSVTVEGVRYPWHEYLLYEAKHGFRWLVEAKGHWSFVEPIRPGEVRHTSSVIRHGGRTYSHFQSGTARVDHVLGEFYWAVASGDRAETADYVSPPHALSSERSDAELNWSLGTYTEPQEIWSAFHVKGSPPSRVGVGMNQPSPFAGQVGKVWSQALLGVASVFLIYVILAIVGGKAIHAQSVTIPGSVASGSPEAAAFLGPIDVPRSGNLRFQVRSAVNNSWLYLDGALINDATGAVDEFDENLEYYYGTDSDGAWSEGSQTATAYVGHVPAGRYTLRLAPQWEAGHPPPSYQIEIRSRVPRFYQAMLAILALLAWPIALSWRRMRFEAARWSESDHPWTSSSDD